MPSFTKCILVLALAFSACASSSPAFAHRRHALAARNASPVVHHHVPIARSTEPKKRTVRRRSCNPRTTSSSEIATSTEATATSATAVAVGKLGGAETSSTEKTSATPTSTKGEPTTTKASSTKAEPTTTKASSTKTETTNAEATSTKTSSSAKSTATKTSSSESYLSGTQTGDGTFFATGLGACGITNTASDHIVAVSELLFDSYPGYDGVNPNNNPVCGKKILATYEGKSVLVTVVDRCTGCSLTSLDFTTSAFDLLAEAALGRIHGMTWDWQ